MTEKDRFYKICDYIDSQQIVDSLINYFGNDDLNDFCNYLQDVFNIDIEENYYYED